MTDLWFDSVFIGLVGLDLVCGLHPFPLKMERRYLQDIYFQRKNWCDE